MSTLALFVVPFVIVALLLVPFLVKYREVSTGKQFKTRLVCNLCLFIGICALGFILPMGGFVNAIAADGVASIVGTGAQGMGFLAAALATGIACVGSGIAVASGASAAIGAVSEDPKSFGKAIIFVVLGEGIAIYGLLISILIINKL